MRPKPRLSQVMTESQFENGYWYATELKDFAIGVGVPAASRLRKDELETAIRQFIRTGQAKSPTNRSTARCGVPDVALGLRLDLPVVNYTSNPETKAFIEREAARLQPGFKRASGTRYLLNRWREQQLSAGKRITYRHLVEQAIKLNQTEKSPLRLEHGRYINFISDFMAANRGASHGQAVKAWHEVKALDAPKTYEAWATTRRRRRPR